jgi:serine/threonine protein kinase
VAEQAVSLGTLSMALPPRYDYLLEIEQGGGAGCHLAIDPGSEPAGTDRPAQKRDPGAAAGARAASTGRLVAVHWAPRAVAEDDEQRAHFAARAAAFMPLRHPNLISIFEAVADRRLCHWVSEFVPGEPLSRLLEKTKRGRRALSTRQIVAIVCDIARALEHAHGAVDAAGRPRPVVHRNLCPASVLVTYAGVVKVNGELCAGLPKVTAGPFDDIPARLAYLAPECCSGGSGDTRCDVYALGAILWEALAGRPRNRGLTPQQAVALRLRGGEPTLEDVCPSVLPALAAVTGRALSTAPGDRHQSVGALREELEKIGQLDALKHEPSPLFGFMCNHFFEEYAALQALLEQRSLLHTLFEWSAMSQTGSGVHEAGLHPSLRESGLRRVAVTGVAPPTAAISRESHNLPTAKLQRLELALPPARVFGRTRISVAVLVVAGAFTALGSSLSGDGTSPTVPSDRPEPATIVPSVRPQLSESVHAKPTSAARLRRALDPVVTIESAEATAAVPARPVPEVVTWKRLRPVRDGAASRAKRRESPIEPAVGTPTRTVAVRQVATPSKLDAERIDGTGVDLRMLKERPPRAIDTENPYSP